MTNENSGFFSFLISAVRSFFVFNCGFHACSLPITFVTAGMETEEQPHGHHAGLVGKIIVRTEALCPILGTRYSAAIDIKADIDQLNEGSPVKIAPGESKCVPTGLKIFLPTCWRIFVAGKSGLATKNGLWLKECKCNFCPNETSREDLCVIIENMSFDNPLEIFHGQIIGQIMICKDWWRTQQAHLMHAERDVRVRPKTQELIPVKFEGRERLRENQGGLIRETYCGCCEGFRGVIDPDYTGRVHILVVNRCHCVCPKDKGTVIAVVDRYNVINYQQELNLVLGEQNNGCEKKLQLETVREVRGDLGFGSTSVDKS